ncbi:MAG: VOC family protein [Solirubrobacterales bacterium]|nr:VOC family protein [Solirubrobacterales bacterium]
MTQTVFPSLTFKDAKASIDWLERVMGAERLAVYEDDEGRVVHAELRIGTSSVMLGDQRAGSRATPPGVSVIYVVVDDADAAYARANAAGARVTEPVDQDYGSRDITITDPDGNRWTLGTYAGAARSSDTLVTRS